jgi:hypothetical protein
MGALIRWIAIVVSLFVVVGFFAFAVDEMNRGSKTQQNALDRDLNIENKGITINDPSPAPTQERVREQQHGDVREAIDDVNDVLLAPFASLIDSDNVWVNHGVPSLLALLIYGGGLGMVANMMPKQRHTSGDWRAA